jgi:hypothetical protein
MAVKRIEELIQGQPPTPMEAEYFNAIVRYLNALTHLKTSGLNFEISDSLATLDVDFAAVAQAIGASFVVTAAESISPSIPAVEISAGLINLRMPKVGTVALDADTPPRLPFAFPTGYVYAEATLVWDFDAGKLGEVESVAIKAAAMLPNTTFTAAILPLAFVRTSVTAGARTIDEIDQLNTGDKRLLVWQGEYVFA